MSKSEIEDIEKMTWKGRQIKNLSKEELMEAFYECAKMYVNAREEAYENKMREIDQMKKLKD